MPQNTVDGEHETTDPRGGTAASVAMPVHIIRLDANSPGRRFDGIGAVSAGASSRLLPDYPEPQRSQILDALFAEHGAFLQHLKVEAAGDENSTCGSEPSHAITVDELANPKARGYEFWLMAEARKRNPKIMLDCLPWCYPRWVGDRFSEKSAQWIAAFLKVARRDYGLELDWVAAGQNEQGTDIEWISRVLRPILDREGFSHIRLQAPDDSNRHWEIFEELKAHPEANDMISACGYHYSPSGREPWDIDCRGHPTSDLAKASGKPLWASEEWSQSGRHWGGSGALFLARLMNKAYARDRATKFLIWCPVDAIYPGLPWHDTGLMQADTPWCGAYAVWPAIWAVAHTTQFARPGWMYMDDACGQIDEHTWRGSHVALRDPDTGDWSLIVCAGDACRIRIAIGSGLKGGPVHVWKSNAAEQFVYQALLVPAGNAIELDLETDAVYTFTSTTGQRKGEFKSPERQPFPFPYVEHFDSYSVCDTPRYFADQKGTFEVVARPGGGLCLAQIVPEEGILWRSGSLKPHTVFGDDNWRDYAIEADVLVTGGDVEVGGRYADQEKLGCRFILSRQGRWQMNWQDGMLLTGELAEFDADSWHHLRLEMKGERLTGFINGQQVAAVSGPCGSNGMAFLASTYDRNLLDNVKVS